MNNITSGMIIPGPIYSLGDIIQATEPKSNNGEAPKPFPTGPEVPKSDLLPVTAGTTGELLKQLFDKEYSAIQLDKEDALRVAKSIHSLRRGGASGVRLLCAGDNCDFREACELWRTKLGQPISVKDPQTGQVVTSQATAAPEGLPCPLEELVVTDTRTRYATEFQDLIINGDSDVKVLEGYINDLCQIEMLTWRCAMIMSLDYANPLIQTAGAVTGDGRVIWTPALNPVLEALERLQQRKTRILNDLVKTPREKYKKEHAVGNAGDDSLGRRLAARKAKIKEITGETLPDQIEIPEHVKDNSKK